VKVRLYFRNTKVVSEKRVSKKTGKTYKVKVRRAYGRPEKFDLRKKQVARLSVSDGISKKIFDVPMRRYAQKRPKKNLILADLREKSEGIFYDYIREAQRVSTQQFVVAPFKMKGNSVTHSMIKGAYGNEVVIQQNRNLSSPIIVDWQEDNAHPDYIEKTYDFKSDTNNHLFHIISSTDFNNLDNPKEYSQLLIEATVKFMGLDGKEKDVNVAFDYFEQVLQISQKWLISSKTPSHVLYEMIKDKLDKAKVSMSSTLMQKSERKRRPLSDGYQVHIKITAVKDKTGKHGEKYAKEVSSIMKADKIAREKYNREKKIKMEKFEAEKKARELRKAQRKKKK